MCFYCIASFTNSNSCVLFNSAFYIILCKLHFNPPRCFNTLCSSFCLFLALTRPWLSEGKSKSIRCCCLCWCVIDISPMVSYKMHAKMIQCSICTSYIHTHTHSRYCCSAIFIGIFLSSVLQRSSIFSFVHQIHVCWCHAMSSSFLMHHTRNLLTRFNLHLFVALYANGKAI